jgi:ribonuclease T1
VSARWIAALLAALAMALPAAAQRAAPQPAPAIAEAPLAQLPPETRQAVTLIRKGGPYLYARDGVVFVNREGQLPREKRGYYREYTVKTPGVRTRGARRIIAGAGGELYYTEDHYNHFVRIRE